MKKSLRVFLIIIIVLAVVGLAVVISYNAINDANNRAYSKKVNAFENRLSGFTSSYEMTGMSEQTKNVIVDFLALIPSSVRELNNIIFTNQAGKIIYQYNDKYVSSDEANLNIAWNNQYALMTDEKTGVSSWLYVDHMVSSWAIDNSEGYTQVGEVKYNTKPVDLLKAYEYHSPQEISLSVSIYQMKSKSGIEYCFWIRDGSADSAIYAGLQDNGFPAINYGFLVLGTCMIVAYWFLLPVWVFLDARRRQIQPLPWALLVLLTNVVGLVVYWIVQTQNGKAPPAAACPACGKPVKKAYPYCPWCGVPLVKACKGCGKTLEPGWVACPWCGQRPDEHEQGT